MPPMIMNMYPSAADVHSGAYVQIASGLTAMSLDGRDSCFEFTLFDNVQILVDINALFGNPGLVVQTQLAISKLIGIHYGLI
jgi:hypothetical protein